MKEPTLSDIAKQLKSINKKLDSLDYTLNRLIKKLTKIQDTQNKIIINTCISH